MHAWYGGSKDATYGAFTAAALRDETTAHATVARMLREASAAFTRPGHPRGCLLVSAATNCTPESADAKARLRDLRRANSKALAQKIAAGKSAGELPPDVNARALAAFYMGTVQGMARTSTRRGHAHRPAAHRHRGAQRLADAGRPSTAHHRVTVDRQCRGMPVFGSACCGGGDLR
jgi:hypothetical protein